MQYVGHFMLEYREDMRPWKQMLRAMYSFMHIGLVTGHFFFATIDLILKLTDLDELVGNAISTCFSVHAVTKLYYFLIRRKKFYRTLGMWDNKNIHPLFKQSDDKYQASAVKRIRRTLILILSGTQLAGFFWAIKPFIVKKMFIIDDGNSTVIVYKPKLICEAWYPIDVYEAGNFVFVYIYQVSSTSTKELVSVCNDVMF